MPSPAELEMQKLLQEFLKRSPAGLREMVWEGSFVTESRLQSWSHGEDFPSPRWVRLISDFLKCRIAEMVIAEPTNIRVEVESEGGYTPDKARVTVYDGKNVVAVVTGRIEKEKGADGGYYNCIKLKEEKDTFSCLLCGTTTPLPHICPAFYPKPPKSPT